MGRGRSGRAGARDRPRGVAVCPRRAGPIRAAAPVGPPPLRLGTRAGPPGSCALEPGAAQVTALAAARSGRQSVWQTICHTHTMRTTLDIDDDLMEALMRRLPGKSKTEA